MSEAFVLLLLTSMGAAVTTLYFRGIFLEHRAREAENLAAQGALDCRETEIEVRWLRADRDELETQLRGLQHLLAEDNRHGPDSNPNPA